MAYWYYSDDERIVRRNRTHAKAMCEDPLNLPIHHRLFCWKEYRFLAISQPSQYNATASHRQYFRSLISQEARNHALCL